MNHVLLVEPYDTGSHREWARSYQRASRLDVTLFTMPGRFWKWRMHGAAVTLSRRLREARMHPDVVLASDMLDVATFLGLSRDQLHDVPVALYMHENQLAYPAPELDADWSLSRRLRAARRDEHYPFVNLTSMLAADAVLWNSAHNRDSFLAELPRFLNHFPDHREAAAADAVAARSHVLPLGLDLAALDHHRRDAPRSGPPLVLWNHRWEHDKGPDTFFTALKALMDKGVEFRVAVLGESFGDAPPAFEGARAWLGERVVQWGYAEDRGAYARWLWDCDVVVSTARHEFFGAAVAEAVYCHCMPVLPHALAYPELIPPRHHDVALYDDFDGLVDRLARALEAPDPAVCADLANAVSRFDWCTIAPRYDESMRQLTQRSSKASEVAGPVPPARPNCGREGR